MRRECCGQTALNEEIAVDLFAGGGGASTGFEIATGRIVDIAVNHDPAAVLLHRTNHPYTEHYTENVWDVDPITVCRGRPVGMLWASPDCKHFSRAKGAALCDRKIRGLAWVILRWAGKVRPRVIMAENVPEFLTWGPVRKGKPIKTKAGTTFDRWLHQLCALGYAVKWRELTACDYGAPTSRTRLVICARCDGNPIVWPEPTHGAPDSPDVRAGLREPWHTAAEIIDWSLPTYSIFATKNEIRDKYGAKVVRPLADNTMKRIARGLDKFVIKSGKPFIVGCNHTGNQYDTFRGCDIDKPYGTVTSKNGNGICVPKLSPVITSIGHTSADSRSRPIDEPLRTVVTKSEHCVMEPKLASYIMCNNGENVGRAATEPVPTITTGRRNFITAANLIQYHDRDDAQYSLDRPLLTVDGSNRYGLSAAYLSEWYGNAQVGISASEPLHTVTAKDREALTAVFMQQAFAGGYSGSGRDIRSPLPTITTKDHNQEAAAYLAYFKGQDKGQAVNEPLRTITACDGQFGSVAVYLAKIGDANLGFWPQVRGMLNQYCGYRLAADEILLFLIGEALWYISDIGLRMLSPKELYAAMGFPTDYQFERDYRGNIYPRNQQVAKCGNAVCPPLATAMVRANLPEWCGTVFYTMADVLASVSSS